MSALQLKPGHSFMLIGTAEQGFKAPEKKTIFLEDMSQAEQAKSVCSLSLEKSVKSLPGIDDSTSWFAEFGEYVLYECYNTSYAKYSRDPRQSQRVFPCP